MFVFFRLVYPMLPVYLDCLFLIAPSVLSNFYTESMQINWTAKPTDTNVGNWKVVSFYYFNKLGPELMILNMSIDILSKKKERSTTCEKI